MIDDKKTLRIQGFGGVDNRTSETRLAATLQRNLVNLDIAEGRLQLRHGYTLAHALPGAHSLWSDGRLALCAAAGTLYRWDGIGAPVALRSGVNNPVSYASLNGDAYFSDGMVSGKVDASGVISGWGIDTPPMPTLQSTAFGGLDAGTYQVAITAASATGEESGAERAATVGVSAGGGIAVALPQTAAAMLNVYVSAADSTELRHAFAVPAGMSSALIGIGPRGKAMDSQFLDAMPPGVIVAAWRGRLISCMDGIATFSEPLRYGLTDRRYGYLQLPADISLCAPVAGGIFFGTAKGVQFAAGTTPEGFTWNDADDAAPVPGSLFMADASDLGLQLTGQVAVWMSSRGWNYGLPDGSVSSPVADRLALPNYERGAGMLVERDGLRQLLAVVMDTDTVSAAASDSVVAEVMRDGVVID